MILEILWLIPAILTHEFGHWIAFRMLGYKPNISFKVGIILVGEDISHKVKVKEYIIIAWAGVFAGIPWVMYANTNIVLIYFMMCMLDIQGIISCLGELKFKGTLLDLAKRDIKRLEEGI